MITRTMKNLACRAQFAVKREQGFSLIEIAVVLVIVGLIIAAALPSVRTYKATDDFYKTRENLELADNALREYFGTRGRYPCPADPTLGIEDDDFGKALDCQFGPTDPCPTGGVNVKCVNTGTRDADGIGGNDFIMIGTLPVTTLAEETSFSGFSVADGKDPYLNQLTYAVTQAMTYTSYSVINPVNGHLGAITVLDEAGKDIVEPAQSAHYVVVSHGENGRGGFNLEGNQVGDCDVNTIAAGLPSPPPPGDIDVAGTPGIDLELENCDNDDGRFILGLQSYVAGDDYYDDQLIFHSAAATSLWRVSASNPLHMYNTNYGNVGVNEDTPLNKLDINGTVRAKTSVTADWRFCDITVDPTDPLTGDCLNPDAIGAEAMSECPAGQVATGIEGNDLVCIDLFDSSSPINFTCPSGKYLTGFSSKGIPDCADPPAPPPPP